MTSMNRRSILTSIGTVGTIAIAGCSGGGGSSISVEEIEERAVEASHDELMRNPDEYRNEYVHYEDVTIDAFYEGGDFQIDLGSALNSKRIYVEWDGDRFVEGDVVEIWAQFTGLLTRENSLGGSLTTPEISAQEVELIEEN